MGVTDLMNHRNFNRRSDSLIRERDSIRRLLDQANLDKVNDEIESMKKNLESLEMKISE